MQVSHRAIPRVDDGDDDQWSCFSRTKVSEDVKHTFAWTIERFSERQEQNSQVGGITELMVAGNVVVALSSSCGRANLPSEDRMTWSLTGR